MIKAEAQDRELVVSILAESFDDNKSVNYIVRQDRRRVQRLVRLMEYSFDYCQLFGEVYLSDDRRGCVLAVLPEKKRATLRAIILDLRLVLGCVGLGNVGKAMAREARIKKVHPPDGFYYLWFIGVRRSEQNKGVGGMLLKEVLQQSEGMGRPVYLETSTEKNVPWYRKFGFEVYEELDFGYRVYCMRN
ncbi:MAG TPA: GNAT family N-acetyltransferase [Puia sp.]